MEIKYSKQIPQVYFKLKEKFGVSWDRGIIITYGDTIYCKYPVNDELKAHEEVHVAQQTRAGVELWWKRYFNDKKFRLEQEVEAYNKQLDYAWQNYSDLKYRATFERVVSDMARIYGGMCTKEEAERLLT